MHLRLLNRPHFRSVISRCYCDDGKSIYQRDEEGKKPRTVHGELYPQWRKPWIEREDEWRSKLSVFVQKNPSAELLTFMQSLPNITFKSIKQSWKGIKVMHAIENQKYISQRIEILGANLGAIHFFTYRNCAVRLKNSKHWLVGDPHTLNLPVRYQKGYMVEAIDCKGFALGGLRYEGVANMCDLNFLKWLSLKNNEHIDVWCLDRIAGQNGHSLEYLDISGCNLSIGCIHALARMPMLKVLVISDLGDDEELLTGISLLEENNKRLLIKIAEEPLALE